MSEQTVGATGALSDMTTLVVGASRGIGRGIATAFADAGAPVVAVARTGATFPGTANGSFQVEVADAGEPMVAASLLDRYEPDVVILVAGASPHMRPLQHQTWETFSLNWQTDVRITFHWLREALLKPLRPGSKIVVFSSGVALNPTGSPLSGGYAGAKATQRLITGYAQDEANRAGLDIPSRCCSRTLHPRPASASRPCRRTRLARASPGTSTSSRRRICWSPPRSPAPLWSSSHKQMPSRSLPVTG
jgi:NAD(P)-dependent dehydrogenase (short-subunit alcohol dehydrogenase family)